MTGYRLRLCRMFLLSLFSVALFGCTGNRPAGNASNPPPPSGPPGYEGYHDITNCNAILAWVWDTDRPNDPVKLEVYDGNLLLATVTADGFRQDLLDAGKGNGKHGMYFEVPSRLKDGKKHIITIKIAGTPIELSNGPKDLVCSPEE